MGAKLFFLVLVLVILSSSVIAEETTKDSKQKYVSDEIVVRFKNAAKESQIDKLNAKFGASEIKETKRFRRLKVSKGKNILDLLKMYKNDPNVEYAEPNYFAYALMSPNDPLFHYQWNLNSSEFGGINAEKAWDISTGSGVVVAVIDTGIAFEDYCFGSKRRPTCYYKAPDLANTCFVPGIDIVNNDLHPNDDHFHGTLVAGVVAQSTNNNMGVAGVAYDSCLMPVKVLDKSGGGTYADIAEGIIWAADHGAQVISLSLGGTSGSQVLKDAVSYADSKSVIIVAAMGNDGEDLLIYPAAYEEVIAVGATQFDKSLAPYSNYGPTVDIVAPGGNKNVDQNKDGKPDGIIQNTFDPELRDPRYFGYFSLTGTSLATPHVSGIAALIIAYGNANTPDEVRAALEETANDLGAPGRDDVFGYGLVDADAALQWNSVPDCFNDSDCDDRLICNGAETCQNGKCSDGIQFDCSSYNIFELASCNNDPDSNPFTWDFKQGFVSECVEPGNCTIGAETEITSSCSIQCGGCESSDDCKDTDCGKDGCIGDDYYDYENVSNTCSDCACSANECGNPIFFQNDSRCINPKIQCWAGSNQYLFRSSAQVKKFCKCAAGSFVYSSYNYELKSKILFRYNSQYDDEIWTTNSLFSSYPIYEVRCGNGIAYSVKQDYYR